MRTPFLRRFLHPLGIFGLLFVAIGFGGSVVGLVVDLVTAEEPRPYEGLLTFCLYPCVMFFGIALLLLTLWLERRRARKLEAKQIDWRPRLDPRVKRHRRLIAGLVFTALMFLSLSIVGAIGALRFMESNRFCGEMCHAPMEPQHVAHQFSPHANVDCVQCHVGPGAAAYVEAKVSGLRQLSQMLTDSYPRPIRAHPMDVPSADATCIGCHWRERYHGEQLSQYVRYGFDLKNTRRAVRLVLNVGGGNSTFGARQGIHWHANPENRVWFRSTDPFHQEIPWVKVERADGTVAVYKRQDASADDDPDGSDEAIHLMSCRDCHNRPAHRFMLPDDAVDLALESGGIDRSIPSIKTVAVSALGKTYATVDEALSGIRSAVEQFYSDTLPSVLATRREEIERSIAALHDIYRRNAFPEMNVNGYTFPDNSGHLTFPGCLRCHDGKHTSDDGTVLSGDCQLCHRFVTRSPEDGTLREVPTASAVLHPFKPEHHEQIDCWTCHSGSTTPYASCMECHPNATNGHAMAFQCSICHKPESTDHAASTCGPCHPLSGSPLHQHAEHRDCVKCHTPHGWNAEIPASCTPCHEESLDANGFKGVESTFYGLPSRTRG